MDRGVIDRLPSSFIDPFSRVLLSRADKEKEIFDKNMENFLYSTDEAARGRALEAKGREFAYRDIHKQLMGDSYGSR